MSEERFNIGGYPTVVKLPIQASWDKKIIVATLTLEIHQDDYLREEIRSLCGQGCLELLKKL